jgi:ABC-type amino acid transport system permease subunit
MKTKWGISGSTLKWIAIISMAIDHIGAGILEAGLLNAWGTSPLGNFFGAYWQQIYQIDQVLRKIGRPAFPIFCFLLVEGFLHTHDVKKYAIRLGLFALISEIPFDLLLFLKPVDWSHQNVFFTLLLGLLAIWFIDSHGETVLVRIAALGVGMLLGELLRTDYGAFGVGLILVLYVLRKNRFWQCILGALLCVWEYTAPIAFLFIWFYNGERGRQPKWFFYWFYPVHLFCYYILTAWVLPGLLM